MKKIHFKGPFRWFFGAGNETVFRLQDARSGGIYLWTIPYKEGFLTYYVGETGRSFAQRMTEHARDYLSGLYRIYDPVSFAKGVKILLWEGMWKRGTRERMSEFLERFPELGPQILQLLETMRIFIATLDAEKRIRQRIEAEIAHHLQMMPGLVGQFQDEDIRYWPKRENEDSLIIGITGSARIHGMPNELEI